MVKNVIPFPKSEKAIEDHLEHTVRDARDLLFEDRATCHTGIVIGLHFIEERYFLQFCSFLGEGVMEGRASNKREFLLGCLERAMEFVQAMKIEGEEIQ